jgi:hypothetical protein
MSEEEIKDEKEADSKVIKDSKDTEAPPEEVNLNEYRNLAGLDVKTIPTTNDEYIMRLKSMAGL